MKIKDLEQLKSKLRKEYISLLTSKQYKIPADTKQEAELKWLEFSIVFDNVTKTKES